MAGSNVHSSIGACATAHPVDCEQPMVLPSVSCKPGEVEHPEYETASTEASEADRCPAASHADARKLNSAERVRDQEDHISRILGSGNSNEVPAMKARIADFPELERAISTDPKVYQIMKDVSDHYGATQTVLTWRSAGFLYFKSCSHSEVSRESVADSQLFNHTITRRLPVIAGNAAVISAAQQFPSIISKPKFYAAAPLVLPTQMYVGTLCIVDSRRARSGFSLGDASFLEQKSAELAGILHGRLAASKPTP